MKPDLSRYRPAVNQSEVMMSKYVVILDESTETISAEGTPFYLRNQFKTYDDFYKRLAVLMKVKKVFIR
jgi:hypothetical protein